MFALIITRDMLQIGVRDLDVEAENVVEADLQRIDAGAGPFAGFDGGNVLPAVLADVA